MSLKPLGKVTAPGQPQLVASEAGSPASVGAPSVRKLLGPPLPSPMEVNRRRAGAAKAWTGVGANGDRARLEVGKVFRARGTFPVHECLTP